MNKVVALFFGWLKKHWFPLLMLYGFIYQGLFHYSSKEEREAQKNRIAKIEFWLRPHSDRIMAKELTIFDWNQVCVETDINKENYIAFYLNDRFRDSLRGYPDMQLLQSAAPKMASNCISKDDAVFQKIKGGFYLTTKDNK